MRSLGLDGKALGGFVVGVLGARIEKTMKVRSLGPGWVTWGWVVGVYEKKIKIK